MNLSELFKQAPTTGWVRREEEGFAWSSHPLKRGEENREILARVFQGCVDHLIAQGISKEKSGQRVRLLWREEGRRKAPPTLPALIGEEAFLRMYALGEPLSAPFFCRLWKRLEEPLEEKEVCTPFTIGWNTGGAFFHDVDATPPGVLAKFIPALKLKKDHEMLAKIAQDLEKLSEIEEREKRWWLTLAILSHGAAYREIEGRTLWLPSWHQPGKLIAYVAQQHLIAEGLKTISLYPTEKEAPSIYLCQGTELWPSQPSMLGSILANFAEHGSATEAYAHSWRRIHKHLRDLPGKPWVAGHSMGGSLAIQIGLYSHPLVEGVWAFNPPMPNARDYHFYHQMSPGKQEKIRIVAHLDDFAFWRIGAKVMGHVTLYLGKKRWRYFPVGLWDCLFLLPAFVKFFLNVYHAFPAHQRIAVLYDNWVSFRLSREEIEKENAERITRFDYLHFFPKLYDPMKNLLHRFRRLFKWRLEKEYLRNEIEILALHERDLIDTLHEANRQEVEKELKELRRQKEQLRKRLYGENFKQT